MKSKLPPDTRRCARCGRVVTTWLSRGNGPDYCLDCCYLIDLPPVCKVCGDPVAYCQGRTVHLNSWSTLGNRHEAS